MRAIVPSETTNILNNCKQSKFLGSLQVGLQTQNLCTAYTHELIA